MPSGLPRGVSNEDGCAGQDRALATLPTSNNQVSNRNERAATFVDTCIAIPILLLLSVGLTDLFRVGYTSIALHYAAERATRWAILGGTLDVTIDDTLVSLSREESVEVFAKEYAERYGVFLTSEEIGICPLSTPDCTTDAIDTEDYFLVTIRKPIAFSIMPLEVSLNAQVLGRNEP